MEKTQGDGRVWVTRYKLNISFRSELAREQSKEETIIENAPILHIEGYRLRQGDQEKYASWLNDYACNSFIPLIMGLPGIKGYDLYKQTGSKSLVESSEWEYPDVVSALYFTDIGSYEKYTGSRELLAFNRAIHNIFPDGLNPKLYVQYRLAKSFRK